MPRRYIFEAPELWCHVMTSAFYYFITFTVKWDSKLQNLKKICCLDNSSDLNGSSPVALEYLNCSLKMSHTTFCIGGYNIWKDTPVRKQNKKKKKKKKKKVREKSRECHIHKPQPFPDTKRKRKPTNPNKHKSNKHTKALRLALSSPSEVIATLKGLKNITTQNYTTIWWSLLLWFYTIYNDALCHRMVWRHWRRGWIPDVVTGLSPASTWFVRDLCHIVDVGAVDNLWLTHRAMTFQQFVSRPYLQQNSKLRLKRRTLLRKAIERMA